MPNRLEKLGIKQFKREFERKEQVGTSSNVWYRQRKRALHRDGYECSKCGISQDEHKEKYGRGLEVHHIKPRSEFDEDSSEVHNLSNLKALCISCHRKADRA